MGSCCTTQTGLELRAVLLSPLPEFQRLRFEPSNSGFLLFQSLLPSAGPCIPAAWHDSKGWPVHSGPAPDFASLRALCLFLHGFQATKEQGPPLPLDLMALSVLSSFFLLPVTSAPATASPNSINWKTSYKPMGDTSGLNSHVTNKERGTLEYHFGCLLYLSEL